MAKVKQRKKISKEVIKMRMMNPTGDFFMEKLDAWTYKIHMTSRDAGSNYGLLSKYFEVEDGGKGYYGSAYIVRHYL